MKQFQAVLSIALLLALIIHAIIAAPQQFPDWSGQLANLTGGNTLPGGFGDGVTGLPGAGDITWPSAGGGIGTLGDLQNQTQQLPGGGFGSGFLDQLQNQTVPSPPDVSAIQGVLPGAGGTSESGGDS